MGYPTCMWSNETKTRTKEVGSLASFSISSNHTRRVGTYIAEKFDSYTINVWKKWLGQLDSHQYWQD